MGSSLPKGVPKAFLPVRPLPFWPETQTPEQRVAQWMQRENIQLSRSEIIKHENAARWFQKEFMNEGSKHLFRLSNKGFGIKQQSLVRVAQAEELEKDLASHFWLSGSEATTVFGNGF